MKPTICLALFNYNQAKYLPDSLGAIQAQTDKPDELLLFDDASSDGSLHLLKEVSGAKTFFNTQNRGLFSNIEIALKESNCDYIALTAADDILHPNFLAEHRKLLQGSSELGLICSDHIFFEDTTPHRYELFKLLPFQSPQIFHPDKTINYFRSTGFAVYSYTCVYHRKKFQHLGGLNRELKSLADMFLNQEIALNYSIGYIPFPLAAARIVKNSYGQSIRYQWKERAKIYQILFNLVLNKRSNEFKTNFLKAKLFSNAGLFCLFFMAFRPQYWRYFPALLRKNWKLNIIKLFRILQGKPIPQGTTKPIVVKWP